MIKVIFECNNCSCKKGTVITWDRDTVVECEECKKWETIGEDTHSENEQYVESLNQPIKKNDILKEMVS